MRECYAFLNMLKEPLPLKINYKYTALAGLAFLSISAFWQLYDFIIPLILKNTFELSDSVSGLFMSADNVVGLFMLPFFGALSDRTNTKLGRRMPYIVLGTIVTSALMILLPNVINSRSLFPFIFTLGVLIISTATYRSPAVALMPDITPKPFRSKGNAVINLMGAAGGVMILLLTAYLVPDTSSPDTADYRALFYVTSAIMLVSTVILLLTIKEPLLARKMRMDSARMGIDPQDAKKDLKPAELPVRHLGHASQRSLLLILISVALWFMGYNAITTAFSKYALIRLGMNEKLTAFIMMTTVIAATISFIPAAILSTVIGRKKSVLSGVVLLAASLAVSAFFNTYSPLMFVTFSLSGVAWAAINVNSLPMVLEMSTAATIGKYTGFYYSFSMSAQVITPVLSGFMLQHAGYHTLFPYSIFFIVLAFFTMLFVKHGDTKIPNNMLDSL